MSRGSICVPAALAFGRDRYEVPVAAGQVERLPIRDAAFDTVVSMETIEHLTEPLDLLREVHRVLRPEGILLISTPNALISSGHNPYPPP